MSLTNEAFDALTNDEKRAYLARCCAVRDAEVEALRAALGAEREHCDEWRALFGTVRGSSPMKFVKYHEDKDHYVAALLCERHDARRAPKIGGGE